MIKIYPNILTTGVFIYVNDDANDVVVVNDDEINAEFLNIVKSSDT